MGFRSTRVAVACAAVTVTVVAAGVGVHASAATQREPEPSVPDPLAVARDAVTKSTFTGTVRVEWVDGTKRHSQEVKVADDDGLLVVGSQRRVMADGDEGLVRESDGWVALGADASTDSGPAATVNYRFTALADGVVAGHQTRVIEAVQLHGPLRERFYLDRDTGVLLRRQQIEHGRTVRTVEFVAISAVRPAATPPPTLPRAHDRASQVSPASLGRGWQAPRRVGAGFELVDAYRRKDGSLQLYYTDGLHGMSVFELHGRLNHDALPSGGHDATLDGHRVRVYDSAGARTFVWDTDRAVYACVTDAGPTAVEALLAKLPAHRGRGVVAGLTHFVLAPFSWE